MTSTGPFQPQLLCDSLISLDFALFAYSAAHYGSYINATVAYTRGVCLEKVGCERGEKSRGETESDLMNRTLLLLKHKHDWSTSEKQTFSNPEVSLDVMAQFSMRSLKSNKPWVWHTELERTHAHTSTIRRHVGFGKHFHLDVMPQTLHS